MVLKMDISNVINGNRLVRSVLSGPLAVRRVLRNSTFKHSHTVIDRLAENVAGDIRIRIPEFMGQFELSPKSDLFRRIAIEGTYEPKLVQVLLNYLERDGDFIDVGANVGFFSVLAAQKINGRVLAIEPTPAALARLKTNIGINDLSERIIVYEGAASDDEGEISINVISGKEEYSSLGSLIHPSIQGSDFEQINVKKQRIDNLVDQFNLRPKFIKVDVEGAESLAFKGALNTLMKHRPIVLSELSNSLLQNFGTSSSQIVKMFEGLGYDVVDPIMTGQQPGRREFGDILCVPRT